MDYTNDEVLAVTHEVVRQGGVRLEDRCMPRDVVFHSPPYPRERVDREFSCGCGNALRFVIEYNGENGRAALVTACASCDDMGRWPRYKHVIDELQED